MPVVNVQKIKQCQENRRKLGQCKCTRAFHTQRINARLGDFYRVTRTALYVICRNCRRLSSYLSMIECETVDVTTTCLMKYEFLVVQGATWLSFLFENTFIRACIWKNQIGLTKTKNTKFSVNDRSYIEQKISLSISFNFYDNYVRKFFAESNEEKFIPEFQIYFQDNWVIVKMSLVFFQKFVLSKIWYRFHIFASVD